MTATGTVSLLSVRTYLRSRLMQELLIKGFAQSAFLIDLLCSPDNADNASGTDGDTGGISLWSGIPPWG